MSESSAADVFRGALDGLDTNKGLDRIVVENEAIYSMACRNAVKANTVLAEIEVEAILNRLKSLENPYTCPHGRPVIVKLTRRELEKLFKRIV